jgi:hypothetical protein
LVQQLVDALMAHAEGISEVVDRHLTLLPGCDDTRRAFAG